MRTGGNLPVVIADAMDLARRVQIAERGDGVIAHAAVKNVAEDHHRPPRTGERHTKAAALAGVVADEVSFRVDRAILRGRKKQARAVVWQPLLLRGRAVALVEPCREHRPVRVERERLKSLAYIARRDRLDRRERRTAIGRACGEDLAVERLVA